jgi:ATP-binding cassette subfamily F protein uup
MKILSVEHLSKSYGEKLLFQDISFTIGEKERIGLIGVNGTGKSTLLKIVAGNDLPDEGVITAPNDYSIGYLPQEPELMGDRTVLDQIFQSEAEVIRLLKEYESTAALLEKNPQQAELADKLFELQKKMDALNAWEASTNAKIILTKLGIEEFDQKIAALSGGQKKRVALAQVLIETPDLLILDEPTNHLDFETIQWLQDFLKKYPKSVFFVTHDRYFLDAAANRMFELANGNITVYKGNYQDYLEAKALREEQELSLEKKHRNLYKKELAWIKRGAKARSTKQKARIQRFESLKEKVENGAKKEQLDIQLKGSRLGKQVFELKNASKTFGNKVILNQFHWIVKPHDRIGIVGRNGSGKSTLLNILAGKTSLDEGELLTGQTVKIAYYTQERTDMDENKRIIAYIREEAEVIETNKGEKISAAQMLERFLFPMNTHGTPIRKLSGGEKRRLYLLKLLMSQPNVLLLDEPTNDLDTETLTVLEDYLEDFPGVVITVSHDRYFLDKTVDQLLILEGEGNIRRYYGSYSDFLYEQKKMNKPSPGLKEERKTPKKVRTEKKRMTYFEKKEWEEIEEKISNTERMIKELEQQLEKTGSDFVKAQSIMEELNRLNEKLEFLIERWSYLSELASR